MSTFLIKLIPLSPFFFGGERTFGDMQNQNYFAKSNPFPQQTSILGMLRKELLIQDKNFTFRENWNDYSMEDKNRMKELIGAESFKIGQNNDFGKIKSISPVFITNGKDHFIPRPFDFDFEFKKEKGKAFLDKEIDSIPFMEGYNSKKGLSQSFISENTSPKSFSDIFEDFIKVGNAKDKTEDDSGKFFKQQFYTLKKGYSFAFFAEIDFELKSSTVFLGADNSSFKMEVEQTDTRFENIVPFKTYDNKISLLSDALVKEDIYAECQFAITETVDFRTTDVRPGKFDKSKKYEMLKRGSVLFFRPANKSKVESMLNNQSLQKIGYNIYK